jgi:CheY-like chemotaxis protein
MAVTPSVRILYVDDEPINLRLFRDVFAVVLKQPEAVATAATGAEALALLQREPFDVVISDQRMPGMSGTALLQRVRDVAPNAVRMLLTGFSDDRDVAEALRTGLADGVISKPWRSGELDRTIRDCLARRRGARSSAR